MFILWPEAMEGSQACCVAPESALLGGSLTGSLVGRNRRGRVCTEARGAPPLLSTARGEKSGVGT